MNLTEGVFGLVRDEFRDRCEKRERVTVCAFVDLAGHGFRVIQAAQISSALAAEIRQVNIFFAHVTWSIEHTQGSRKVDEECRCIAEDAVTNLLKKEIQKLRVQIDDSGKNGGGRIEALRAMFLAVIEVLTAAQIMLRDIGGETASYAQRLKKDLRAPVQDLKRLAHDLEIFSHDVLETADKYRNKHLSRLSPADSDFDKALDRTVHLLAKESELWDTSNMGTSEEQP